MTSRPFDPLFNADSMQRMQRELGRFLEGDWLSHVADSASAAADRNWRPRADRSETDDSYSYWIDVPGVELQNIEVTIKRHELLVAGTRNTTEGVSYSERPSGEFKRQFELPADADESSVSASVKNGVLEIRLSKLTTEVARQVPINKQD